MASLKEPVAVAVEQIRKAFPASELTVREDGQGGVYVVVESADMESKFVPAVVWVGFRITFQYPYADCYPHFVDAQLRCKDGQMPTGAGIQPGHVFEGRAAYQLSRRSKRLNPQTDTALMKLEKVLFWLRSHA